MKKTAAVLLLLLALPMLADKPANYAGRWSLDKARSANLPPRYEQVTSHELTITQNDKELAVTVRITVPDRAPDPMELRYQLDGTPTKTETLIRTPAGPSNVPTVLQAKPAAGGGLVITIERELPSRDGQPFKGTTVETWHLDADGKTLTIDRADEMPRGRMESKLVFTRVAE